MIKISIIDKLGDSIITIKGYLMFNTVGSRLIIILVVLFGASYTLLPTYEYFSLDKKSVSADVDLEELKSNAINLGLDLQGGMYILLEVDIATMAKKLANNKINEISKIIDTAYESSSENATDFFQELSLLAEKKEIRLVKYFTRLVKGSRNGDSSNEQIISLLREQRNSTVSSALEILRNRIDEFGVSEPIIQRYGLNRIIVELAGINDPQRAKKLLQRTASMELSLVLDKNLPALIEQLDKDITSNNVIDSLYNTLISVTNDPNKDISENIFKEFEKGEVEPSIEEDVIKGNPFFSLLTPVPEGLGVLKQHIPLFEGMLNYIASQEKLPKGGKFLWGSNIELIQYNDGQIIEYLPIYFVSNRPAITVGAIQNSQARIGTAGTDNSGKWIVELGMNSKGAKDWSDFTGRNIGKQVAIILDDKVFMSPYIRDRIPSGQTVVSGFDDANEAKDIANVLRAGELPAPILIKEERTVGPSLGSDSIDAGKSALSYAFICIIIFMLIYYKISGLISTIALLFNLILIMSILALMNATLTLPGIAGLILTVGMSIDSNVIIFERIKRELALGKNVYSAIESGYNRAFITILDANITTLIAALVLANIGSGPIKGFAVTLSTGIVCSMFTAIFVTRTIFMLLPNNEKLSI